LNLPNKLTISRIFLTLVFLVLIRQPALWAAVSATVVFALAAITDYYDGYLARKYQLVTDFGKLLDPIADKFLILAAFLAFLRMNIVEDWMVILILGREIIVTSLRLFALRKKVVLAAAKAGKHKTVSQIVAIFVILGFIIFKHSAIALSGWSSEVEFWWKIGIDAAMIIAVLLALISGASFIISNRKLIKTQ